MSNHRTTSMITLKARQAEAYETIMTKHNAGVTEQLINLPTGLGKTILAIHTAGAFHNTLITVPTLELLEQTESTIKRLYPGESVKRLHGKQRDITARFTITTVATLVRRIKDIPANVFSLLIVDECHHSKAGTWEKAIQHFTPELLLGLSATPERMDGLALSDVFKEITYAMTIKEAVEENYLAAPIGIQVNSSANLDRVRAQAGDFNQAELSSTVNTHERNHLIVDAYEEHAPGRKTIAFTVTIEHAKALAAAFNERGIKADWVSGADPERNQKIADYQAGRIEVIANANLLTEGFDDPATSCIIMARPTTSRVLYTQAAGRGLRTFAGKDDCVIIDVADNTRKHRLVNVWDFWGTPQPANTTKPTNLLEHSRELSDRVHEILNIRFDDHIVSQLVNLLEPAPKEEEAVRRAPSLLMPAHPNALRMLYQYGYNVFTDEWTVGQANHALKIAMHSGWQRNPNRHHALTA